MNKGKEVVYKLRGHLDRLPYSMKCPQDLWIQGRSETFRELLLQWLTFFFACVRMYKQNTNSISDSECKIVQWRMRKIEILTCKSIVQVKDKRKDYSCPSTISGFRYRWKNLNKIIIINLENVSKEWPKTKIDKFLTHWFYFLSYYDIADIY